VHKGSTTAEKSTIDKITAKCSSENSYEQKKTIVNKSKTTNNQLKVYSKVDSKVDLNDIKTISLIDINKIDSNGFTPLMYVCAFGSSLIESVKWLLSNGADPNIGKYKMLTPNMFETQLPNMNALMICCRYCTSNLDVECVKLLINSGANLEYRSSKNYTVLMHLCENCNTEASIECAKLLLSKGASVSDVSGNNFTPLMLACKFCNTKYDVDLVKLLIDNNGDVNSRRKDRRNEYTLLLYTVSHTNKYKVKCTKLLIDRGIDLKADTSTLIACTLATRTRLTIECAKLLIDAGINLNCVDYKGMTALMCACYHRNKSQIEIDFVKLLINAGADLNIQDNNGLVALLHACNCPCTDKNIECIKLLINTNQYTGMTIYRHNCTDNCQLVQLLEEHDIHLHNN